MPSKRYLQQLQDIDLMLQKYIDLVCEDIESSQFRHIAEVNDQYRNGLAFIEQTIDEQIQIVQEGQVGNRIGMLQMQLLVEMKDIFRSVRDIYDLYHAHHTEGHSGV